MQDHEMEEIVDKTEEVLDLASSTSWDDKARNETPTHRKSGRPKAISSIYLQPGRALDLYCDPPKEKLWDDRPLWTPSKIFVDGDDTSKALLSDMRYSLYASRSAAYSPKSLPLSSPLDKCLSQIPTVKKIAFNDNEMKMLGGRRSGNKKECATLTILKRPSDAKKKLDLEGTESSAQKVEEDALAKLERFCKSGDIKTFESALKLCMKSLRSIYYGILDLATHPDGKDLEVKNSLLVNFAHRLERAYSRGDNSENPSEFVESIESIESVDRKPLVVKDRVVLLKRLSSMSTNAITSVNSTSENSTSANSTSESTKSKHIYLKAYELLMIQARKHHSAFYLKLSTLLNGHDPNLILKRDLSSNYVKLIQVNEFKQMSEEATGKFNAIKPFLYREFMNIGLLERTAMKTFELDITATINPSDLYEIGAKLDMASVYFTKAAIVHSTKVSPFECLISVSKDRTYLSRNLLALCAFIRDPSNHCEVATELKNLSKLYTKFFGTFTLIYDAIFNHNYRRFSPYRSMKNQRWLFPDGVKDPLYDPDPATRICNHLSRFVDEEWLEMFKYYHYWSGIRLLMLIGYKIIDRLDLDQFDENVQVALYGLSVGFRSNIVDSVHMIQLAKFLIAITTICEPTQELESDQRVYRTACRLLVEFFALLLQSFNKHFSSVSLFETIKANQFNDQMMSYLMPITLLTHWMSNNPLFFKFEAWNRKWSFSISFLADFWVELSVLSNSIRMLKNNGLFNSISISDNQSGYVIPEIANSFGISAIFNNVPSKFSINDKNKPGLMVRLFSVWENVKSIANREQFFVYQEKKGFVGHSDAKRVLIPEPEYFDTPKLLPVPLKEIEDCINNRKKELEEEQGKELEYLIQLAKSEAQNEHSILHDKILVIVRPRYLVLDTNVFLDVGGLETVLSLLKEPHFTILVPLPVISELKGLRNKKAASPNDQDETHAKQVSRAAVNSLKMLETTQHDNIKLLLRNGRMIKIDINYQEISLEIKNNDRLIIEAAKEFSESVCQKSIRIPSGNIWIFRDVLLVTRDRIMMLLANAYRLPTLDVFSFAKWTGFNVTET